ncbi:MAG: 2-C-methyl-D-erythritol 2,4-cyclodiphosphate synthase [Caldisericaceae bacterium]
MEKRVGIGYDSHRLVEGRKLILGGIEIPFELGLLGHSDGDALTHAIMDALLGASGLPDIGVLFPDSDPSYAGVSSMVLLTEVKTLISAAKVKIVNIDCVVVSEKPKLSPYYNEMKKAIAKTLEIDVNLVNIKAKTNEGMGFIGEGKGIACLVVALVEKN